LFKNKEYKRRCLNETVNNVIHGNLNPQISKYNNKNTKGENIV